MPAEGRTTAERLLRNVTSVIAEVERCGLTWHERDDCGVSVLWYIFLAAFLPSDTIRERVRRVELLAPRLMAVTCEHGMVVFTVRALQLNVNVVLPGVDTEAGVDALMRHFYAFLDERLPDYAVKNTVCVDQSGAPTGSFRRRFVPSREAVASVKLVRRKRVHAYVHGRSMCLERVLEDPRDICAYQPLATLRYGDAETTAYWHRFPCGTLGVLRNPFVDFVSPLDPPEPLAVGGVAGIVHPALLPFVRAMDDPATLADVVPALRAKWIPPSVRNSVLNGAVRMFGIQDALVLAICHDDFPRRDSAGSELYRMQVLMRDHLAASPGAPLPPDACVDVLADEIVFNATHGLSPLRDAWREWTLHSPFVADCLDRFPRAQLSRLIARCPQLHRALAVRLHGRIGAPWTRDDVERAHLLVEQRRDGGGAHGLEGGDEEGGGADEEVRRELARLRAASEHLRSELTANAAEEGRAAAASPGKRTRRRKAGGGDRPPTAPSSLAATAPPPDDEDGDAAARTSTVPSPPPRTADDDDTCVVCMAGARTHLFVPCGHQCVCASCADVVLAKPPPLCPLCRTDAMCAVQVFK